MLADTDADPQEDEVYDGEGVFEVVDTTVKEAYDAVTQLVGDMLTVLLINPVIVWVIVNTRDDVEVLEYTVPLTDTVCVCVLKGV